MVVLKSSGDSETELLMKISAEELKSVLENLVESKLSALQVEVRDAPAWPQGYFIVLCRWIYCQS